MNDKLQLTAIGRITKDIELKEIETKFDKDSIVTNFSIAIDMDSKTKHEKEEEKKPYYLDLSAFDNFAHQCSAFLKKGMEIKAIGVPRFETYEKDGEKRFALKMRLQEIHCYHDGISRVLGKE